MVVSGMANSCVLLTVVVVLCQLLNLVLGKAIDNAVEGVEIECFATTVRVGADFQNEFKGRLYVKGHVDTPECRADTKVDEQRKSASMTIPFSPNPCMMNRRRSVNPRGVFVIFDLIVEFHPVFNTKVDRQFTIECFYMEANKTVSTEIEVSKFRKPNETGPGPTPTIQTQTVAMPICRYEILDGGPKAEQTSFGFIGQSVYHKWTCVGNENIFCMTVRSCIVDDGGSNTFVAVDERGCSTDANLIADLDYIDGMLMAGVEAHVFKFADRTLTRFQCQISVVVKDPEESCEKYRPDCSPASALLRLLRRRKRSEIIEKASQMDNRLLDDVIFDGDGGVVMDVDTTLEAFDDFDGKAPKRFKGLYSPIELITGGRICIATMDLFTIVAVGITIFTTTLLATVVTRMRKDEHKAKEIFT